MSAQFKKKKVIATIHIAFQCIFRNGWRERIDAIQLRNENGSDRLITFKIDSTKKNAKKDMKIII
jgi:hypothetical protein